MRLLIDTHALLWFCEGNPNLSGKARAAMEDDSNERYVSHATAWEVAIKVGLGKLTLQGDYRVLFPGILEANGFVLLPSEVKHYEILIASKASVPTNKHLGQTTRRRGRMRS